MLVSPSGIRVFEDGNEKLKSLLSQASSEFDSIIFLFNHSVRYKLMKSELGIQSVSDLLFPNGYGICSERYGQSYYLYYDCVSLHAGIHRLQGTIYSYSGHYPDKKDLHVFVDRARRNMKILYFKDNQIILEARHLETQKYVLTKQERKEKYTRITWKRLNEIVSSRG